MRMMRAIVVAAGLLAPGAAMAQLDEIHNPGFEITFEGDPQVPEGWRLLDLPFAIRRSVGDGGVPAALVRSGEASLALNGGKDFVGATTDILNIDTFEYYNLNYTWGNTAVFSGYYAIPADAPVVGAKAGLKMEFRRPEPDNSIYQAFESLTIDGHTNGQWVYVELVVHAEDFLDFPPYANRVSLLPIRFGANNSTGTIFWDDLKYEQFPGGGCYPDFTGDGVLDLFDFLAFVNEFNAQTDRADCTGDGVYDLFDFLCFVNEFNDGCP